MEDLPPGFRFYPTEEELVAFYLHNKLEGRRNDINKVIPVIDIYNVEPCHLPKLAGDLCQGETEQWFFFSARQEREARGGRPNRTTATGYWKATGSPGYVYSSDNRVIGVKKTMVFYRGKAPTGKKTKWKMNEYRAIELSSQSNTATPTLRHEFSLCRIYVVSGSLRAFDRRPLEPQLHGDRVYAGGCAANSSQAAAVNRSTSSDTCNSGNEDHSEGPSGAGAGVSGTTNWLPNDGVQTQEPLWDWEQLNWL